MRTTLAAVFATVALAQPADRHVAVISIDGFGAVEYLPATREAALKGCATGMHPNLDTLMRSGAYARGVEGVLPTLTYPAHATLVTGVPPAKHGVLTNARPRDRAPWHFDRSDIQGLTLWDAARKAGLPVAIVTWPSTNGADAQYLIPENLSSVPNVTALVRDHSTPGLFEHLEAASGPVHLLPFNDPEAAIPLDRMTTSFAAEIVRRHKPALLLMHLLDFDHRQHAEGPGSLVACRSLNRIDGLVGEILRAYRDAGLFDRTAFFIVSDHGFLPTRARINVTALLPGSDVNNVDVRLGGGSAALYPKNGGEVRLKPDAAAGLFRLITGPEAARFGGFPGAAAVLCAKSGYFFTAQPTTDVLLPSSERGFHGHCPDEPGIDASFIASGAGIRRAGAIPRIRMIDVGPTIAAALGVALPDADGHAISGVLK